MRFSFDLDYLYFLQCMRDGMGTAVPDFMLSLTKFAVSIWPFVLICFVYWVFDRKEGRKLIGALSLSMLLNGFLKATFCVYRPWIKDSRIEPYGDAKVSASGYSFPSGHTMYITPTVGGIGLWQWAKQRWISILCFVVVLCVMFTRNFLGCHTLADVLVGCLMGFLCIFLSGWIEKWIDGKTGRGTIAAIIALAVAILAGIYFLTKQYPMDYKEDGTLIADPSYLIADCFEGLGAIIAFYFGRIIEQKGFNFDKEMHWKDRFIIGVIAIIPLYFWRQSLCPLISGWSLYLGRFLHYSVEIFYAIVIVPWAMGLVKKWGILDKTPLAEQEAASKA